MISSNGFLSRQRLSALFLVIFIQSLVVPNISFALTAGQHSPEYTSYEEAGSSDMVNLLTGDFNLNIPLVEVPTPEGNFPVPLFYNAGIGSEQEASWAGLGWNINTGGVVRDVNQYPDDASGEANTVTVQNLTGVYGYDIKWAAPYRQSWNSVTGSYGNVNLLDIIEVEWGSTNSVGIIGFHVGDGRSFRPEQTASAIMAIASMGAAASAAQAAGKSAMAALAKDAAVQLASQQAMGLIGEATASTSSGSGSTAGYWQSSHSSKKSLAFSGNPLTGFVGIKTNWKTWIDQTRQENMYGTLYAGKAPTQPMKTYQSTTIPQVAGPFFVGIRMKMYGTTTPIVPSFLQSTSTLNSGAASDINFSVKDGVRYQDSNSPILLANDQYNVNAPGISGSISPYRVDNGSVSMPREMTDAHVRLSPVTYLDYKVPFVYENSPTNQYLHHVGAANGTSPSAPGFNYGIQRLTDNEIEIEASTGTYRFTEFDLQDQTFQTERIRSDIAAGVQKKFPQANHIEWLSNDEIRNATTYPSKFLDFLPGGGTSSARYLFRTASANGLGGYSITSADGRKYHFALPVYSSNEYHSSVKISDPNQNSSISKPTPFASTWLLTAITGPDFIDRNANGMADDGDWGYWIKFNYGKYASNYDWRQPYAAGTTTTDPQGVFKNYSQGQRELYYLNTIESRSHVALFMKSEREDGYSANGSGRVLKLDEIALLKKDSYNALVNTNGLTNYSNGVSSVCMSSNINTAMRTYINKNTLRRVLLNYDYSLCKQTTNALGPNNSQKGKLTLTSVSIRGRNDLKVFPDYVFEYNYNPSYNVNGWDGWGMHSPTGAHTANQSPTSNGSAWSLTRVITPLGSDLNVNYERDSYSSISGEKARSKSYGYSMAALGSPVTLVSHSTDAFRIIQVAHSGEFAAGDKVHVDGHVSYKCGDAIPANKELNDDFTVVSVTPTQIMLDRDFRGIEDCSPNSGTSIVLDSDWGYVYKYYTDRKGGNLRVGSLVMNDMGLTYKSRYLYTNTDGTSSGVVSQEPSYIRQVDFPFYDYVNYPSTPVMYGRVTVLRGKLSTDSDFTGKEVFEFETPKLALYTQVQQDINSWPGFTDNYLHKMEDRTSRIGRMNQVTLYDNTNTIISQSQLEYTDQIPNNSSGAYQGIFSQGTLLFDMFNENGKAVVNYSGTGGYDYIYVADHSRANRTTQLKYPNVLKKVTNNKDGFSSYSENKKWDFISGQVIESVSKSSLGIMAKTVNVPAYTISQYSDMGPRTNNLDRKNMLAQLAATYTYRIDGSGTELGLIEASASIWKNNWSNYTTYDGTKYTEISDGDPVWRVAGTSAYQGSYGQLDQANGTLSFSNSNKFDFTPNATNTGWKQVEAALKYDHYNMPLMVKDANNIHSSIKVGYANSIPIATANHAKYNEIAFSSAEDIQANGFFGGEVSKGNGTVKRISKGEWATGSHTGDAVLYVPNGTKGFIFKSTGIERKMYRASAWTNSASGRIYYTLNGVETASAAPILQVNGWYQINLEIPVTAAVTSFEVGVKSLAADIVFDDFRFQPADASMTCYVYNPTDYEFLAAAPTYSPEYAWMLDNDNLFVKYEYNERGLIVKTYKESFQHNGVKLLSESKDNFRRGLN